MEGWIKIHRSLLEWEWYSDTNCVRLALHFLLKANYQSVKWRGMDIERGQFITSRAKLSAETSLSDREIRTAIDKLAKSEFSTIRTTNKFTIVTVCNYDKYQSQTSDERPAESPTDDQQATNERPAKDQQETTNKEYKKERIQECTHTVDTKKGVVGGKYERELLAWIERRYPEIHRMPEPFNESQLSWMLGKYTREDIRRIVAMMDNKGVGKKNKSAFATFSAFAGRDAVIRERRVRNDKLYTYEEMCDEIPKRACSQDFERVELEGRSFWRKKAQR